MTRTKAQMQDDLIALMEYQKERPVVVSCSNYDFIKKFLSPKKMPDFVERNI